MYRRCLARSCWVRVLAVLPCDEVVGDLGLGVVGVSGREAGSRHRRTYDRPHLPRLRTCRRRDHHPFSTVNLLSLDT